MTPAEVNRMDYRFGLFKRRGMHPERASDLVHDLVTRDAEKDTRRVCAECAHFQHSRTCAKRGLFLMTTLQRCPLFGWQAP